MLFALLRRGKLEGADVVATGWYRRSPVPCLELRTLIAGGRTRRCWVHPLKLFFSVALVGLGIYLASMA